jgi:hypothetical protein
MNFTSGNPESKYQLEPNAAYKFNKAAQGSPELRPGTILVNPTKHSDFTEISINYRVFNMLLFARDATCSLKDMHMRIGVEGVQLQGYLRELNKMGILRMVTD